MIVCLLLDVTACLKLKGIIDFAMRVTPYRFLMIWFLRTRTRYSLTVILLSAASLITSSIIASGILMVLVAVPLPLTMTPLRGSQTFLVHTMELAFCCFRHAWTWRVDGQDKPGKDGQADGPYDAEPDGLPEATVH